jgi:F-type H+-transporting ATPase subunit delta
MIDRMQLSNFIQTFSRVPETDLFILLTVSGGFATINPDSTLNINAVEAFELDQFSPEAVKAGLAQAQKLAASGSEEEKAAAKVEIEVYEALTTALAK